MLLQVGALRALSAFASILSKTNPVAIANAAAPLIEGLVPMISFATDVRACMQAKAWTDGMRCRRC